MKTVILTAPNKNIKTEITPPASKSESNRALIMNALSGNKISLSNISEARDTVTMQRLLGLKDKELNVLDAGTTMRFLIAYTAVRGENRILTGTPRMQERPVKILVDALRDLGAEIKFLKNEGYPPLETLGFNYKGKKNISIKGDVSSQYISALLMVGPYLPEGLELTLEGTVASRPYIEMTLQLMKHFGASFDWTGNVIRVNKVPYNAQQYFIESDWSGASYWYSIAALAEKAEIFLIGNRNESLQGDRVTADIMENLGVHSEFKENGVLLTKKAEVKECEIDFINCPDIAQTLFVICAAKNIKLKATGLESLRIKETDRILALQKELGKVGSRIIESNGKWELVNGNFKVEGTTFETYEDHRMAMAFAPLALLGNITIEEPEVVNKSYPGYWKDLEKAGFKLNFQG